MLHSYVYIMHIMHTYCAIQPCNHVAYIYGCAHACIHAQQMRKFNPKSKKFVLCLIIYYYLDELGVYLILSYLFYLLDLETELLNMAQRRTKAVSDATAKILNQMKNTSRITFLSGSRKEEAVNRRKVRKKEITR